MAKFIAADVVVVPFPFSDLSQAKRRPALILATLTGDDLILCQITSRSITDHYAVEIDMEDFLSGSLSQVSNIRPNRLFTADRSIVLYKVGEISAEKLKMAIDGVMNILHGN